MFILDSKRARAWLSDISERYCMMRKACAFSWLHASFARKGRQAPTRAPTESGQVRDADAAKGAKEITIMISTPVIYIVNTSLQSKY